MAYSERIKSFAKIRAYMRDFYVYGFRTRGEFTAKSVRSYDNERRRIESWMGEYMAFRQDAEGRSVFMSVDSRAIPHNPLYRAFKAKSFTANDILLHFYILDMLADCAAAMGEDDEEGSPDGMTVTEITEELSERYLSHFPAAKTLDESTIRKKLKEYGELGLLVSEKDGRAVRWRLSEDGVDLAMWREAAAFFSEADPLGVVGSYLLDRYEEDTDLFRFKHHYALFALDSEILFDILTAMREGRGVALKMTSRRRPDRVFSRQGFPVKIHVSTQSGRQYLCLYSYRSLRYEFFRLDQMVEVEMMDEESHIAEIREGYAEFAAHLWGVSNEGASRLDHLEMVLRVEEGADYIADRLQREKRCGRVKKISRQEAAVIAAEHGLTLRSCDLWRYSADVYDAGEMIPWLRTFIGRIEFLTCTNKEVENTFRADLLQLCNMYHVPVPGEEAETGACDAETTDAEGGEPDAVQ